MSPPEVIKDSSTDGAPTELRCIARREGRTGDGRPTFDVELQVPENLLYFQGHFDGDPVLPGVVQLNGIALEQIEACWPDLGALSGARRLKFIKVIRPGNQLTLHLEQKKKQGTVGFTIANDGAICTSGILLFTPRGTR